MRSGHVVLLVLCVQLVKMSPLVVKCKSGTLIGSLGLSRDGREFVAFTGVPFAKPPVGKLRLANPVPFGKWTGVYDATRTAPPCVQARCNQFPPIVRGSEDCLYLNVFRPKERVDKLPVIVSIYGGAFCHGTMKSKHQLSYWMDERVILIEMNYRTGLLGFMTMGDTVIPGNFGLKDQALALNWVVDNVADFGGDPNSITLLGCSAGAACAHYLTLAPATRDKVKGAVLLSGSISKSWSLMDSGTAKNRSLHASSFIGCNQTNSRDILVCLRQLDAKVLPLTNQLYPPGIPFAPVIEPAGPEAFITQDPRDYESTTPLMVAFANGERSVLQPGVLEQFGVTSLLKTPNVYIENIVSLNVTWNDEHNRKSRDTIYSRYFPTIDAASIINHLSSLFEDAEFIFPAIDVIKRHSGPKYFARFECNAKDSKKTAIHGAGNTFIFNETSIDRDSERYSLSKKYMGMIVNFAKFRNPTPEGFGLKWEQYPETKLLRITCDSMVSADADLLAHLEDVHTFWAKMYNPRYKNSVSLIN